MEPIAAIVRGRKGLIVGIADDGSIADTDEFPGLAATRPPQRRTVTIDQVGRVAAFLVSDAATGMTGGTTSVDAGFNSMG